MEQDMLSMISHPRMDINEESSDSSCAIYIPHSYNQSRIQRFKGVVPQQNGHWGAQIYANHQRIWLGTFRSEVDAAMAYDSASIKLRKGDYNSHRNFPMTIFSILEPKFQSHFSTDAIFNMIRDGSYPSKFVHFLKSQQGETQIIGLNQSSIHDHGEFSCTLLFEKELTPSDVGKLNRLVIPKRYAVKHFPYVPNPSHEHLDAEKVDQVQLEFYDREMSLWKFRYCYWKSSQSFVFTRGWNRFVNEKGLRANDTISFYMYASRRGGHFVQSFLVIDVVSKDDDSRNASSEAAKDDHVQLLDLSPINETKGFKLFGVQIEQEKHGLG